MIALFLAYVSPGALMVMLLVVNLIFFVFDQRVKEKGVNPPSKSGDQYRKLVFFHPRYLSYLYFSWQGRIGRMSFNAGLWFLVAVILTLNVLGHELFGLGDVFTFVVAVFLWYPGFILLSIKRLHDMALPTHYILLLLVPLADVWVILSSFLRKGTQGENRFGSNPLLKAAGEELTPSEKRQKRIGIVLGLVALGVVLIFVWDVLRWGGEHFGLDSARDQMSCKNLEDLEAKIELSRRGIEFMMREMASMEQEDAQIPTPEHPLNDKAYEDYQECLADSFSLLNTVIEKIGYAAQKEDCGQRISDFQRQYFTFKKVLSDEKKTLEGALKHAKRCGLEVE